MCLSLLAWPKLGPVLAAPPVTSCYAAEGSPPVSNAALPATAGSLGSAGDDAPPATPLGRFVGAARVQPDEATLQYHRARCFDPQVGRWLGADPLACDQGETDLFPYPEPA